MLKPKPRTTLAILHDVAASALAWIVAFWLRFNLDIPELYVSLMVETLPWIVVVQGVIFWWFGLYRGIWRFASLPDLKRLFYAALISAIAVAALMAMFQVKPPVPRSVLIFDPLLLLLIMGGSRFLYRAWKERTIEFGTSSERQPVIVIGATETAVTLLKELARSPRWRVAAIVDDDPTKTGAQLQGVRVVGSVKDVGLQAQRFGVTDAIIAMPAASHNARRRAVEICTRAGLQVMTVPSYADLVSGRVTVSQIRHVELDDLLGRDPVALDDAGLHGLLSDKSVMVTGAGGSIGAELCRQVARFKPGRLVFFEINEFSLYSLDEEFRERFPDIPIYCVIGDVKNEARLAQVLTEHAPSVLLHAAAYKHVPLMETENAWEAMKNNVLGTYYTATAAAAAGVHKFVFVSTDKAINPTNVMGASKRLAEAVCQLIQPSTVTEFVMVRFGNVLGSSGSVVPKFRDQIARGGPITVTHPEITRYFMSIPEAAQLVLQAGLMGKGGEIFVLDMGDPVKIVDLARDLIRLSGFSEDDIKIVYTGLRAGEKLYEELLADGERTLPTPHPKLRIAKASALPAHHLQQIVRWLHQEHIVSDAEVRSQLHVWMPEFNDTAGRTQDALAAL